MQTQQQANKNRKKYVQLDPITHIIKRPDMYVGSTKNKTNCEYVANDDFSIEQKDIKYSPALLRIFVEPLSNALDNVDRSMRNKTPCTKIKISIDAETGETSVWNDGDVIPIEKNEKGTYNQTMIFGEFRSGSNFNDEEQRITSGRNGYGVKLTNVFSSHFKIKCCDSAINRVFMQEWKNNMRDVGKPRLFSTKNKTGYTEVSWTPDFKLFSMQKYTNDIIKLFRKYIIDSSMLAGTVRVSINNVVVPVKNLLDYSKLYITDYDERLYIKSKNMHVVLAPSPTKEHEHISFVNGVHTKLGGSHVDVCVKELLTPITKKLSKKNKPAIKLKELKQFFRIFVSCTVVNPEFDSQDKHKLESAITDKPEIKASYTTQIMKWEIINEIKDMLQAKEMVVLQKVQRKKKVIIDGLDPANNSYTAKSTECTLIVCEGLSAKTYAVAGIEKGVYGKMGRDWFGIYPLRGKLLNVRNSTATVISKNKVIVDLIQALGIRQDVNYELESNFKSLHYGKVMILTDADVDGIHIEGLILNVFHYLFPTLLQRKTPFIVSMKTPIVRIVNKGTKDKLFYDETKFNNFMKKNGNKKINIKYYKGLGTTKAEDVPDTFGMKVIEYKLDNSTDTNMDKVFHKNKEFSDKRKDWLALYSNESAFSLDDQKQFIPLGISTFIDNELIKFSINDCKRSIPNCIDGLKESQRKILYAVKKRNLRYSSKSLKVAQLGGYVAEHTNYHHGEQNLYNTTINMAQDYIGSNNIPLLYRDGMFGSRLENGKDSAAARYIFTKMDVLTEYIFRKEDDVLLEQVRDDGDLVQPHYYVPILPMILINGCTAGIGTGWSCSIPCYNPLDIIKYIKQWITNKSIDTMDIVPWYRNFTGDISKVTSTKFSTVGKYTSKGKNKVVVNELPIGLSTNKFKELCEKLGEDKHISSYKNYSKVNSVEFLITEHKNGIKCNEVNLKLTTFLHTTNMVLFNGEESIEKYKTVKDILVYFCSIRLEYYVKRKQYLIKNLEYKIKFLQNKLNFITEVINKTLPIMNVAETELVKMLEKKKYDKDDATDTYDYLLKLQVRTFTKEKVQEFKNTVKTEKKNLSTVKSTTEEDMWRTELDQFETAYRKHYKKNL